MAKCVGLLWEYLDCGVATQLERVVLSPIHGNLFACFSLQAYAQKSFNGSEVIF